ncbi:MAG: DegT/DnrJ/EryC1/StrS family aminotransferase [Planctomycetota bacterium]|jgi:dTDP-4-amino-4,6-dideoxygalactose transaminase
MWVRKRIDIGWGHLLGAALGCFLPASRREAAARAEAAWGTGDAFACLSVRSGFDLLLADLDLPEGSEVLVSALTIPDMVRIIEHHGLVAVPLDLDDATVAPRPAELAARITDRTRAILVAHLLGTRFDLAPFVRFAREHDLLLIEDCAQAFEGDRCRGHDEADVSMFSFGPIKTATALAGGILRIRDPERRARLRARQAEYPVQSRAAYLKRVLFFCGLRWLGDRRVFGLFVRVCRLLGRDFDQVLNGSIRNFPAETFFASLRRQPCAPLLHLMARRVRTYRNEALDRRAERGALLARHLPPESHPGRAADPHTCWVFPVRVPDPATTVATLRQHGFDATADGSLKPVEATDHRPDAAPETARALLTSAIYLPLYEQMPQREVERMGRVLEPMVREGVSVGTGEALPQLRS